LKLFAKYNIISLLSTILIFLIANTIFYFLLRWILIEQIDVELKIAQKEFNSYLIRHNQMPDITSEAEQEVTINEVRDPLKRSSHQILSLFDSSENREESFRQYRFGIILNRKAYEITISKSLEKTNQLIKSIVGITIMTILLVLIVSLFINRIILKNLWQPFYNTLLAVKDFQVSNKHDLMLNDTTVNEFRFMNNILRQATNKVQQDFLVLKEFTENASHELQTPLAVFNSKLDIISQGENISKTQGDAINDAYTALKKLSRLNQSLLLLTKIGNEQFIETELIDMTEKVQEKIDYFKELWDGKQMQVFISLNAVSIRMNPDLTDILLNNLFSNATRHNIKGGIISVDLNNQYLLISNSGSSQPLDYQKVFTRFYKPSKNIEENGLGLSIIRQICNVSVFQVKYKFENNLHSFIIQWK
jgi:signal transduction histidine kinase